MSDDRADAPDVDKPAIQIHWLPTQVYQHHCPHCAAPFVIGVRVGSTPDPNQVGLLYRVAKDAEELRGEEPQGRIIH